MYSAQSQHENLRNIDHLIKIQCSAFGGGTHLDASSIMNTHINIAADQAATPHLDVTTLPDGSSFPHKGKAAYHNTDTAQEQCEQHGKEPNTRIMLFHNNMHPSLTKRT